MQCVAEPGGWSPEMDARDHQLRERAQEILRLIEQVSAEVSATIASAAHPGALADLVTGLLDLTLAENQEILETVELVTRRDRVIALLA